jgi:hypothetical protein
MSPIVYLLMPVGVSLVGTGLVVLVQRWRSPSTESHIDAFRRARDVLRLSNH